MKINCSAEGLNGAKGSEQPDGASSNFFTFNTPSSIAESPTPGEASEPLTLEEFLIQRRRSVDQKKVDKHTQEQVLELLKTLVSNFFVDPSDSDWINCRRIQKLVVHCINRSVESCKTI